ncbi:hypothetical protein J6590_073845 [Homalodisca vitripennis]|nr:hypothetical protein J6590_073845 [Homalodisca vitripennis]
MGYYSYKKSYNKGKWGWNSQRVLHENMKSVMDNYHDDGSQSLDSREVSINQASPAFDMVIPSLDRSLAVSPVN